MCSVDWTLTLRDPPANNGRGRSGRRSLSRAASFGRSQPKLLIDEIGGRAEEVYALILEGRRAYQALQSSATAGVN